MVPFFHAAEALSFRRAADHLGVSTAAVSKAVLKLEERLGVKLLARTSRTVALTPEGALFRERCREAIASLQAGREQMSDSRRQPRGELRVSVSFILGRLLMPELARFTARYPSVSLRISMSDRLVRLVEEGVDIALRIGARDDSSLVSRVLSRPRWVVVAAPLFVARNGPPSHPDELVKLNCLRFVGQNGKARDWSFRDPVSGQSFTLPVQGNLQIDSGDHLLEAAAVGCGLAQVFDFMVTEPLRTGRLVEVLASYSAEGPPVHALTAKERAKAPSVRAFLSFLREVFPVPR